MDYILLAGGIVFFGVPLYSLFQKNFGVTGRYYAVYRHDCDASGLGTISASIKVGRTHKRLIDAKREMKYIRETYRRYACESQAYQETAKFLGWIQDLHIQEMEELDTEG